MDDGLAQQLYHGYWDPLVARGLPRPCPWADLDPSEREAWEQVAAVARRFFAAKVDGEIEMLRGAIDGWRRVNAELEAQLAEVRRV